MTAPHQPDAPKEQTMEAQLREIVDKFRKQCLHKKGGGIGFEDAIDQILTLIESDRNKATLEARKEMLTDVDRKYLNAVALRKDDRSMSYIAKKLGYKHASGVDWLLKRYPRKDLLNELL